MTRLGARNRGTRSPGIGERLFLQLGERLLEHRVAAFGERGRIVLDEHGRLDALPFERNAVRRGAYRVSARESEPRQCSN